MSTLGINSYVKSRASSCLIFIFLFSPLKTLYFSRRPPNLSQKNDDLRLLNRWIVVKFKHQIRNPIPSIPTVGNFDIMSGMREIPFAS